MLCAILLAVVSVGCSYNMGERQVAVERVFESEPQLILNDITDMMARKNTIAIEIKKSYGPEATYRESLQPVREIVPYHFGREMGNFCSGIISTVMIPISLPVFAMSGMPSQDYWKHLGITSHNLNFLQASPDDPAVAFRTPAEQYPAGDMVWSETKTLNEPYTAPLINGQIAVEIFASGKKATLNTATNAKGELVIDLATLADKLALPAGDKTVTLTVTVRYGNASAKIEITAHTG